MGAGLGMAVFCFVLELECFRVCSSWSVALAFASSCFRPPMCILEHSLGSSVYTPCITCFLDHLLPPPRYLLLSPLAPAYASTPLSLPLPFGVGLGSGSLHGAYAV